MRFLNCPKNEAILEFVSIAKELSRTHLFGMRMHFRFCANCRTKSQELSQQWQAFFQPEPDLTSSLIRIYSRLQKDETLVLKGWKLHDSRLLAGRWYWPLAGAKDQAPSRTSHSSRMLMWGGGMASAAAALALFVWTPTTETTRLEMNNASAQFNAPRTAPVPFAQIRLQDKNRVQVHYVQPELLHTIEFETTDQK